MTTKVLNGKELYEIFKNEVQAYGGEILDFNDGSIQDILAGAFTTAINEVSEFLIEQFLKTFFDTAEGTDLEKLAKDHFGERFARPLASKSTVTVKFSRPTATDTVLIPIGTVVKTKKDASGREIRFSTTEEVSLSGLTINAKCSSNDSGKSQNVTAGKIEVIESALTDNTITVTNLSDSAGGADQQDDNQYRETIKQLIESLAGATESAIKSAVDAVAGVTYVSLITELKKVRYVDDMGVPSGDTFKIPFVKIYIADESGNFSQSLIDLVDQAVLKVRAAGVKIQVIGALSIDVEWLASITLNSSGPNYATLAQDTALITEDMKNYIDNILLIGDGFNRVSARDYILAIWGPTGSNDITSFVISNPTGNIAGVAGTKLICSNAEII